MDPISCANLRGLRIAKEISYACTPFIMGMRKDSMGKVMERHFQKAVKVVSEAMIRNCGSMWIDKENGSPYHRAGKVT